MYPSVGSPITSRASSSTTSTLTCVAPSSTWWRRRTQRQRHLYSSACAAGREARTRVARAARAGAPRRPSVGQDGLARSAARSSLELFVGVRPVFDSTTQIAARQTTATMTASDFRRIRTNTRPPRESPKLPSDESSFNCQTRPHLPGSRNSTSTKLFETFAGFDALNRLSLSLSLTLTRWVGRLRDGTRHAALLPRHRRSPAPRPRATPAAPRQEATCQVLCDRNTDCTVYAPHCPASTLARLRCDVQSAPWPAPVAPASSSAAKTTTRSASSSCSFRAEVR